MTDINEAIARLQVWIDQGGPNDVSQWPIIAGDLQRATDRLQEQDAEIAESDRAMMEWADAAERMEARALAAESELSALKEQQAETGGGEG